MWVKLCGMVRAEDVASAISLKADAVGVVAVPGTPRCVGVEEASVLGTVKRRETLLTLVLMNPDREYAEQLIAVAAPDLLQFHGDEEPEFAESFGLPYIKSGTSHDQVTKLWSHQNAWAWLYDRRSPEPGDQRIFAELRELHPQGRVILAGGLAPHNVRRAVLTFAPWGVDTSRGIELGARAKNVNKMKDFVNAVRTTRL